MQEHSCALRALNLCDGNRLETPEGALIQCLHNLVRDLENEGLVVRAQLVTDHLQDIIERTLAPRMF